LARRTSLQAKSSDRLASYNHDLSYQHGTRRADIKGVMQILLLLVVGLAGQPVLAQQPRPSAALVSKQTRQVETYLAAREKLVQERWQLQAGADTLSGQIADAKRQHTVLNDASLKALLRDALEVGKALERVDRKLAVLDRKLVDTSAELSRLVEQHTADWTAEQAAALRQGAARLRARIPSALGGTLPSTSTVSVTSTMDAEALQERADLAGDYEEKLLRELARTDGRLRELQGQAAMAGEAALMAQDRRFFDEDDRALRASRTTSPRTSTAAAAVQATSSSGGGTEDPRARAPATGLFLEDTAIPEGGGGTAPPPSATPTTSLNIARSETVVDERTFALLRETPSPLLQGSPADEVHHLQTRREALLRAAARMRVIRADLSARARQQQMSQPTPAR
jgi:hypothetical protein